MGGNLYFVDECDDLTLPRGVRFQIFTTYRYCIAEDGTRARPPTPDAYVFEFHRDDGYVWHDKMRASDLAADGFWRCLAMLWPVMKSAFERPWRRQ